MTETEVLSKLNKFKNEILKLKEENKILKTEKDNLENDLINGNIKISDELEKTVNDIEELLK